MGPRREGFGTRGRLGTAGLSPRSHRALISHRQLLPRQLPSLALPVPAPPGPLRLRLPREINGKKRDTPPKESSGAGGGEEAVDGERLRG